LLACESGHAGVGGGRGGSEVGETTPSVMSASTVPTRSSHTFVREKCCSSCHGRPSIIIGFLFPSEDRKKTNVLGNDDLLLALLPPLQNFSSRFGNADFRSAAAKKNHVRRVLVKTSVPGTFEIGAPIRLSHSTSFLVGTHHR
jgi:hypothetical protein